MFEDEEEDMLPILGNFVGGASLQNTHDILPILENVTGGKKRRRSYRAKNHHDIDILPILENSQGPL